MEKVLYKTSDLALALVMVVSNARMLPSCVEAAAQLQISRRSGKASSKEDKMGDAWVLERSLGFRESLERM